MSRRTYENTKGLRVTVETEALERLIAKLETEGLDAANEQLSEEIRAQKRFAYSQWGVDTGKGRESLQVISARVDDGFAIRIFSDDKRVPFQSWTGKRPSFWDVLIKRPIRKMLKRLGKKAAKVLADTASEEVRR